MARLPEGALMQRAAAGLAYAVARPARRRRTAGGCCCWSARATTAATRCTPGRCWPGAGRGSRRCCSSDRAHEAGLAALRAAGGRVVARAPTSSGAPDVVVDGIVGIGGRPGLRPERGRRRSTPLAGVPVVAVDVPSRRRRRHRRASTARTSRADVTVTFGTHKVAPPGRPGGAARAARSTSSTSASTCPTAAVEALQPDDVAALLPRPGAARAEVHPRRGRRPRRLGDATPAPRCSASPARATGLAGMVRYVGADAVADRVRAAHPEVVGDGPGAGLGGRVRRRRRRRRRAAPRRSPTASRSSSTPTRSRHVDGPLGARRVLTPHAGELAAMLGVERDRGRGRAARARPRGGRAATTRVGAAQGPPHAGRRPRRPGPGHHHRGAVAGHRRRRRRARRADRRAARRRPRRRTTPRRSAPGCTAPPRPWRRGGGPLVARPRSRVPRSRGRRARLPSRGSGWKNRRHDRPGRTRRDRGRPGGDPAQRADAARTWSRRRR